VQREEAVDQPKGIVAALRWRMTLGSYLVISHIATDGVGKGGGGRDRFSVGPALVRC
jgi:hypothetical protein